ncbi:DUF2207 family protein [Microbacterium sp. ASV81]|uniref:DUF2207 domain-containing protein n=1 Tax=Microbacterium capsulatum TaxID=3041921 RepID=A0ABU0XDY8_9MICO|nr:DUF2207 domain-containing protein [Microbacterium sp. ASV81]MDQ4213157.1 DUF2207 domain-containing protein [Microbacterium sp. ASV81]
MTGRLRSRLLALLGAAALVVGPLLVASPAHADANDFSYASWNSVLQLGRDDQGRAELRVTETLVADFPDFDQNHGIIRGLPEWYDGAPLSLRIVSVTDGNGNDLPYDDGTVDNGERQIKIGDGNVFRHGLTTYRIQYTMRDVVHRPTDKAIDEWYWNLLPLNSAQPIAKFTAVMMFDPAVTAAMTGDRACYVGPAGATTRCDLTPDASSATVFDVAKNDLPAGFGVTVAFAMKQGTFAPAPARIPDPMTDTVPKVAAGAGALLALGGAILGIGAMRRAGRRRGRGIVVAQYDVPTTLPPLLAAVLEGRRNAANPAEIVHLAVRKAIRIQDGSSKPILQLTDPAAPPDPLDAAALAALFPHPAPGTLLHLAAPDDALVKRLKTLPAAAGAAAVERGLLVRRRSAPALILSAAGLLAGIASIILAVPGMAVGRPAAIGSFVLAIALSVVALIALLAALQRYRVLTGAGAEAREYLLGVREYIRLAEADRIRMLQSYRGAERRQDGSADVVVLYERLLPYAMLFGMEREWGEVLAVQYEQENIVPTWYAGYAAGALVGSLSGMNSSLSATPTLSSSSSGSSGGGFSGGGGGGGSSGGW